MNVLVIGGGGREHALAWKIKQSEKVNQLFCSPGNAGTSKIARNVSLDLSFPFDEAIRFVRENNIELTVVGPEATLVEGIVDAFQAAGLKIFGPNKNAACLEGSKKFAKEIMQAANVPTAGAESFTSLEEANTYIEKIDLPFVIKADGLAAGKGVSIHHDLESAKEKLIDIFDNKVFGEAGSSVLIEDFIEGPEASVFAICDGENYITLLPAQDHKPIGEGDTGPNTGGMGAYTPAPVIDDAMMDDIRRTVIEPVLQEMINRGTPYTGCLFVGLMMTADGPSVLEFNCRFGDPETQPIMRMLKTDLIDILLASTEDGLDQINCEWYDGFAMGVVMASGGYPGSYENGKVITGIEDAEQEDVVVFHAGTKDQDGVIATSGGRVLAVTGTGPDAEKAAENAYNAVDKIKFDDAYFRTDIGYRILKSL